MTAEMKSRYRDVTADDLSELADFLSALNAATNNTGVRLVFHMSLPVEIDGQEIPGMQVTFRDGGYIFERSIS